MSPNSFACDGPEPLFRRRRMLRAGGEGVTYPMAEEDRAFQDKMRRFVDEELIPFEVEAEMNGGVIPVEAEQRQKRLLKEMGLSAINMPKEVGGDGLSMFQQVLVSEQIGRVTNGLG